MSDDGGQVRRLVLAFSTIIVLVPLLWFAYIGSFSRYMADDYCFAAGLRKFGFVGNQIDFYQHWSGRFASFFLFNLFALPGPGVSRAIPALAILGLAGGSYFVLAGLLQLAGISSTRWHASMLAMAATLLFLGGAPNLYQSLYWMDGAITYLLPLVGLLVLLALLIRTPKPNAAPRSTMAGVLGFATAGFLVGGFNEVLSCGMACGLVVLLVADRLFGVRAGLRRKSRSVAATLAGTLLGLAVIIIAPGNMVRRAEYPPPPEPLYLLVASFKDAGHFVKVALREDAVLISGIFLISAALGVLVASNMRSAPSQKTLVMSVVAAGIAAGVVLVGLMLPVEYATSSYPPGRALVTAQFILSFGVVCSGCFAGIWLAGRTLRRPSAGWILNRVAVCLVLAGAVASAGHSIRSSLSLQRDAQEFAESWDRRDARSRSAVAEGSRSIRIPSLSSMGTLEEIKYDPDDWVNKCVAAYYGLDEVNAK